MGSDHKGVSFPRLAVPVSCRAPKDREGLRFCIEQGVDYVAISFVRSAADIQEVRKFLHDQGANIPITLEAEQTLHRRGILSIPDFIANAGGVICAAVQAFGGCASPSFHAI